ncbi:hypothetical protein GGR64_001476 [Xanthomonas arboricola]|nr:hypothetical protein [Xanthomonas sp. 3307]
MKRRLWEAGGCIDPGYIGAARRGRFVRQGRPSAVGPNRAAASVRVGYGILAQVGRPDYSLVQENRSERVTVTAKHLIGILFIAATLQLTGFSPQRRTERRMPGRNLQ